MSRSGVTVDQIRQTVISAIPLRTRSYRQIGACNVAGVMEVRLIADRVFARRHAIIGIMTRAFAASCEVEINQIGVPFAHRINPLQWWRDVRHFGGRLELTFIAPASNTQTASPLPSRQRVDPVPGGFTATRLTGRAVDARRVVGIAIGGSGKQQQDQLAEQQVPDRGPEQRQQSREQPEGGRASGVVGGSRESSRSAGESRRQDDESPRRSWCNPSALAPRECRGSCSQASAFWGSSTRAFSYHSAAAGASPRISLTSPGPIVASSAAGPSRIALRPVSAGGSSSWTGPPSRSPRRLGGITGVRVGLGERH